MDHRNSLLPGFNSSVKEKPGEMVRIKRYDSSASVSTLDSGRGSSIGSQWSLSSFDSTPKFVRTGKNYFEKAKKALKPTPKKPKSKKADQDKHDALGFNFALNPMAFEGAAQPQKASVKNQVDINEKKNHRIPENNWSFDDSNRKRKNSSSSSIKSDHSGELEYHTYSLYGIAYTV